MAVLTEFTASFNHETEGLMRFVVYKSRDSNGMSDRLTAETCALIRQRGFMFPLAGEGSDHIPGSHISRLHVTTTSLD
ncbi:hypothetical protein Cp1R7AA1_163 [Mesorhizobium phage Cp1R7A-A1]|nr:hypothetical protein Cp1R7AA1_163 [Mesorhizobium phage Cp1R7A-A1]